MLTQEKLKKLLHYSPETGEFRWRVFRGNTAKAGSVAGCLKSDGYRTLHVGGRLHMEHRLAHLYMTGEWPPHEIDHINGNRADNRWCNLRQATRSQNCMNMGGGPSKGVSFYPRYGKWVARIKRDGRRHFLGYFNTETEARDAYSNASALLHGEFGKS